MEQRVEQRLRELLLQLPCIGPMNVVANGSEALCIVDFRLNLKEMKRRHSITVSPYITNTNGKSHQVEMIFDGSDCAAIEMKAVEGLPPPHVFRYLSVIEYLPAAACIYNTTLYR